MLIIGIRAMKFKSITGEAVHLSGMKHVAEFQNVLVPFRPGSNVKVNATETDTFAYNNWQRIEQRSVQSHYMIK